MCAQRVVFPRPWVVELQPFEFDPADLAPDQIAIRSLYTLISPGTELACLSGKESWAKLPFNPGYAGTGEVLAVGSGVGDCHVGDRVFTYTGHASQAKTNRLYARLPEGLDPRLAVFARMAAVSITSLRVSSAELGDYVAVTGLGLVGNLAAQLFRLAGCEVIGIDPSPARRALAAQCGLGLVVDSTEALEAVTEFTRGAMCSTVCEATGFPVVIENVAQFAGKGGEVVLLGSPRGEFQADLTKFLNHIHLWGNCVTFKGAHEWRYPTVEDPGGFSKHSLPRNIEILLRLIADGRLKVAELLTHVLPPSQCQEAYDGLRDKKEEYLGVVFDWTGQ